MSHLHKFKKFKQRWPFKWKEFTRDYQGWSVYKFYQYQSYIRSLTEVPSYVAL